MYHGGISIVFNWRDYLILATELEEGTDEAKLRSSISRAYYAAFCSARNYMEGPCKTAIKRGTPAHQYVIEYFNGNKGEKSNRRRLQIAQNLIRMREERRMADYNNEVHILKKLHDKAQFVLDQSEEVVDLIEKGGL